MFTINQFEKCVQFDKIIDVFKKYVYCKNNITVVLSILFLYDYSHNTMKTHVDETEHFHHNKNIL